MANADTALAVGRSSVLSISAEDVRPLMPSGQVPLDYVWFGGVSITPAGKFWAPGIRGLVISGDINSMSFDVAFSLPTSSNITLISSQWSADNGK
jgi:hypothetical protein